LAKGPGAASGGVGLDPTGEPAERGKDGEGGGEKGSKAEPSKQVVAREVCPGTALRQRKHTPELKG